MDSAPCLQAGLTRINDRFFIATYRGNYGFDRYLARGGYRYVL